MATFDQPSEVLRGIAYPTFQRPGLRPVPRVASFPVKEEKQPPVPSSQREMEASLFHEIQAGAPRNPWAAVGSLSFLLLILLTLVVSPLLHTDPLPQREMLTMLYLQPPGASGSNTTRLQAPAPSSTSFIPASISVPNATPKTQEAPPTQVETTGGVVGGVPGGVVGGAPIGVLSEVLSSRSSAPVAAKAPDTAPVKRIRVASRVVEANLIHDVTPQYPSEAGRARIEGTVVLLATIGTDGTVKDVRVESGLPLLAQAAIDAVKQWRYKPYMIDGEPVEVDSRITINFTLSAS